MSTSDIFRFILETYGNRDGIDIKLDVVGTNRREKDTLYLLFSKHSVAKQCVVRKRVIIDTYDKNTIIRQIDRILNNFDNFIHLECGICRSSEIGNIILCNICEKGTCTPCHVKIIVDNNGTFVCPSCGFSKIVYPPECANMFDKNVLPSILEALVLGEIANIHKEN